MLTLGVSQAKKDLGAWSIPKGEYLDDEEPVDTAKREFTEETSFAPQGVFLELGDLKHRWDSF